MDTTTALTLVAPACHWDKINEIRQHQDKAYPRWFPHINFLFPFVPVQRFDDIKFRLNTALKDFGPFVLEMKTIGYFEQGKVATFHLKPVNDSKLQALYQIIRQTLPEVEVKRDEFHPHMTLAQCKKSEVPAKMAELQQWLGGGITMNIDRICLINRSKTDQGVPFSIHTEILLN